MDYQLIVEPLLFFSRSIHGSDGVAMGPASPPCPSCPAQLAPARSAMDFSERELEHHRHVDDLLPPPTNASTLAAGAQLGDVQDVHQYRCDARRVLSAPFYRRRWFARHLGP